MDTQKQLSQIFGNPRPERKSLDDIFGMSKVPETMRPTGSFSLERGFEPIERNQLVTEDIPTERGGRSFFGRAVDTIGSVTDTIFGGGTIGRAIGSRIGESRFRRSEEGQQLQEEDPELYNQILETAFSRPTAGQIAGDLGVIASNFIPVSRIASLASRGLQAARIGRGADLGGRVAAGAASGLAVDVTERGRREGEFDATPGAGTAIGSSIPLIGPVTRGMGRLFGESFGVTTGAGYGPVRVAFESAGNDTSSTAFREALRGQVSPEQIVNETRSALGVLKTQRTENYVRQLAEISGETLPNTERIGNELQKQLRKFNVSQLADGSLDFSRSAIRFDREAQNTIRTITEEMQGFGTRDGDNTVLGVDLLKQSFSDLFSESSRVRGFVTAMSDSARNVAKQQPGYERLLRDYETSTKLINDVERALSVGNQASVDTSFRKLAGALRVNNEFRQQLIRELDEVSEGAISARIAGQQLSELLPRGIMRAVAGGGAVVGLSTGGILAISAVLQAAVTTSPRVIGEFVGALGLGKQKADIIRRTLEDIAGATGVERIQDFGQIQLQRQLPNRSEDEQGSQI